MKWSLSVLIVITASLIAPVKANQNLFLLAIKNNDIELIRQLSNTSIDVNVADDSGKTALMVAAKAGDNNLTKQLLDKGAQADKKNNIGGSAIMFASIKGDIKTVQLLLRTNIDVNAKGSNGWGALMIASAKGHIDIIKMLLNFGADVNTTDVYNWTPLHRASYENHQRSVKALLDAPSIKINARDDQGATALHHAATHGDSLICQLLITKGATVDATDLAGRTPINYAQENGHERLVAMLENQ